MASNSFLAIMLVLGGVAATSPLLKLFWRPLGGILVMGGFFLGAFNMYLGIQEFRGAVYDAATVLLLLLGGFLIFTRPIRHVRVALLIAITGGVSAAFYLNQLLGPLELMLLVAVFVIVGFILFSLFNFLEAVADLITDIVSSPPLSVVIGVASVAQGILLTISTSLTQIL